MQGKDWRIEGRAIGVKGLGREEKGEWKIKWRNWNREGRLNSKGRAKKTGSKSTRGDLKR